MIEQEPLGDEQLQDQSSFEEDQEWAAIVEGNKLLAAELGIVVDDVPTQEELERLSKLPPEEQRRLFGITKFESRLKSPQEWEILQKEYDARWERVKELAKGLEQEEQETKRPWWKFWEK